MFSENRIGKASVVLVIALALVLVSTLPATAQYQIKKPGAAASIKVTYPNGGETLEKGKRIKITWESTGLRGNVKIVLIDAAGATTDVAARASNRGTYSYTVSSRLADGQYKLAVMSADEKTRDESDGTFTIQKKAFGTKTPTGAQPSTPTSGTAPPTPMKPAGLQTPAGTPATGFTPATGTRGTIGQKSEEGDDESGLSVAEGVTGTASGATTTATTVTNELVERDDITTVQPSSRVVAQIETAIAASQMTQPEVNVSGTNFEPHIDFLSPAGGVEWAPGSQQTIEWRSLNIDGNVQIALVRGDERYTILANTANSGSYNYNVPHNIGLGHDYRLEAVAPGQQITDYSNQFSIYTPQPVDLECAITNFQTTRKTIDAWIFYESRERWMKFDIAVKNNGTAGPIMVPVFWRIMKLPENVVVLQEAAGFGSVYPDAWYMSSSPLEYKISDYERKYVILDKDVNFESGYYRLELYADYQNSLGENEGLRSDNVHAIEIYIAPGR